ncbi:hypothetical protein PFISCL1PPCAC_24588, partial [Pristionchus fissidentatus]
LTFKVSMNRVCLVAPLSIFSYRSISPSLPTQQSVHSPHMFPLSILVFVGFLSIASSLSNFPIVQTSYGAVRGYEYKASNGFTGEIFKKIPFAAPPIGNRRWKKPEPPEPWNYTIDGTFFGPACAQRTSFWNGWVTGFSEDCLNINIYSSKECRESNSTCPVVHYVHGGGALFDGTMMFPDEAIITNFARQGIIFVTVEYRLGIFGTLALGDENVLPANLAIHDILEGLRFVRKEIHNFGGDKEQITFMGHSTGATVALIFAYSPGLNKPGEPALFSRVVAMSGSATFELEEKQVEKSHGVAKMFGCTGSAQEIVDCLRPLSTEKLLSAAHEIGGKNVSSATHVKNIVLAGELMPIHSVKELRQNQKQAKMLLGTTVNEYEVSFGIKEAEKIKVGPRALHLTTNKVNMILGVANIEECDQKYIFDTKSGKFEPDYNTESQAFFMTNYLYAKAQAEEGGEVYLYQYDYPAHAKHTDDMYYILGFHEHDKDFNEEWLSRVYPVYFSNFIKGLPLAPDWKPVNPKLMNYYSINKSFADGVTPKMKLGYHKTITDYYVGIMEYDENISNIKKKVLNSPIQYKGLILTTKEFNIRDLLFYGFLLGVLLFVLYELIYFCHRRYQRSRDLEQTPLLNNNNIYIE